METVHREILKKNYSGLVQAIQRVEEVVEKLVQCNVLTCLMKAEIMEKLSFDRARELLNMLPRRGPQAYTLFCKALEECGEIQALKLLGLETVKTEYE
ncbi:caspase-2-like [Haliotis asinina]|uniref:caspase-2-like n=1 Tax=Haliotis asinina TaxID=109174 RepID=UPI003531A2F1